MSKTKLFEPLDYPSIGHSNRMAYNRSLYDAGDRFMLEATEYYRGQLVDLGCGEAPYRDWFLQFADNYIGLDWSQSYHDFNADVVVDLNEQLPLRSEVADTVVSFSVMEHLREPGVFLAEAFRILKPGGAIILQVPFMWWVHEPPHDYYRYTRYGLEYMFDKAGFDDVVVHPTTGFWLTWTLKFNYQTRRLILGPPWFRRILTLVFKFVWLSNQWLALKLDRVWKCEGETAGYYVVAKKL